MRELFGALLALTDGPPDLAEDQREADEGPVPFVVLANGGHAHEDEDEGLADTAQHLHEIFDSRVGCLGHIFFHVLFHCHRTGCDPTEGTECQNEQGVAPPPMVPILAVRQG